MLMLQQCCRTQEAEQRGKHLYFYTGPQLQYKANAAVLVSSSAALAAWDAAGAYSCM